MKNFRGDLNKRLKDPSFKKAYDLTETEAQAVISSLSLIIKCLSNHDDNEGE